MRRDDYLPRDDDADEFALWPVAIVVLVTVIAMIACNVWLLSMIAENAGWQAAILALVTEILLVLLPTVQVLQTNLARAEAERCQCEPCDSMPDYDGEDDGDNAWFHDPDMGAR